MEQKETIQVNYDWRINMMQNKGPFGQWLRDVYATLNEINVKIKKKNNSPIQAKSVKLPEGATQNKQV